MSASVGVARRRYISSCIGDRRFGDHPGQQVEGGIAAGIKNGNRRQENWFIETYGYPRVNTSGRPRVGVTWSAHERETRKGERTEKAEMTRVVRNLQCSAMKQTFFYSQSLHHAMGATQRLTADDRVVPVDTGTTVVLEDEKHTCKHPPII